MKTSTLLSFSALSAVAVSQAIIYSQCGGQGWTGQTTCVSGATCVSYNERYSQCVSGDFDESEPFPEPGDPPTSSPDPTAAPSTVEDVPVPSVSEIAASAPATTAIAAPLAVTKTLPQASGTVVTDAAIAVSGNFDGGMKLYDRNPAVCQEQVETGEDDAMFILEDGATLSNVILGPSQAEGVHCKGTCTLINVWHSDVCEDAVTLKQTSGTSNIIGGGAFKADDKVIQFNGRGTVSIKDFYVEDFGKLSRSCGNCKDNGGPRNIVIENVVAVDGGVLCGINTNYGDTCTIASSCHNSGKSCELYEGNSSGAEPTKTGNGPDGEFCTVADLSESC